MLMQLHPDTATSNPRLPKYTTIRPKLKIEHELKKNLNNNKISNTIRFLEESKLLKQIV